MGAPRTTYKQLKRSFQPLRLATANIILATSFASMGFAEQFLSGQECQFIRDYRGESTDASFRDEFLYMTTTYEGCEVGGSISVCEDPIHKFNGDITLYFPELNSFISKGPIVSSLNYIATVARKLTSLDVQVRYSGDLKTNTIGFSTVSDDLTKEIRAQAQNLADQGRNSVVLDSYLGVENQLAKVGWSPCAFFVIADINSSGEHFAVVGLTENLSDLQLSKCIIEEVYNALGPKNDPIGAASIFDEIEDVTELSKDRHVKLSDRELLVLKLLYRKEFSYGLEVDRVGDVFDKLVSTFCEF